MLEISRFLGIVITMHHLEHDPPHFHARYQGIRITVDIATGIVEGRFPPRALRHVLEGRLMHIDELMANWERALSRGMLSRIEPLE